MAFTNVYQGSYDDLSEITVNAENMKSAINALDAIRTDREPTMLRRKISGIRIPDPPPPTPTVTVHTRATMTEESTVPLPSTITVRPEHAVVEVGSSVLLYAIDLSTEPTVDFVGWFLNDTLVSSAPNFAYDIPATAEGELLFVARYAEKVPVPTVTIKTQATITEGATLPDTVSTKPDCVKVSVGSTVYIGTKDTAEEPTVDFVGWYLNDTLISEDKVFEYVVPESEEPIIFEARYVEKAPVSYVNVVAQATMLYPNQVLPDTVVTSPDNVVTTKGSTVMLKTEDTASNSLIAFVGWYLNNELVSNKSEFAYTVDTTDATLVFTARYCMVQQSLTVQGKVIANIGNLWRTTNTQQAYDYIKHDNGVSVAIGSDVAHTYIAVSNDGKFYTEQPFDATSDLNAKVDFVEDLWFALNVSKTLISFNNGTSWLEALPYYCYKAVFANGEYVITTSNGIYTSENGLSWIRVSLQNTIAEILTFDYSEEENLWVAYGRTPADEYYIFSGSTLEELDIANGQLFNTITTISDIQYTPAGIDPDGIAVPAMWWALSDTIGLYSIPSGQINYSWPAPHLAQNQHCYEFILNNSNGRYTYYLCASEGVYELRIRYDIVSATALITEGCTQFVKTTNKALCRTLNSDLLQSTDGQTNWERIASDIMWVSVFSSALWLAIDTNLDVKYSETNTYPIEDYATIEPSGTIQIPVSIEQEITGTAVQQCQFSHWENVEGTILSTDNPYYYTPTVNAPLNTTIVAVFQAGINEGA